MAPVLDPTGIQGSGEYRFLTQAGQKDKAFCAKHPVAGPISFPDRVARVATEQMTST